MSKPPILAIFGSANERLAKLGNYDPEVSDFAGARQAAVDIGRQAALRGWHLQVYSLNEDFIEHDLVRGYASGDVGDAEHKKVYVHFAQGGPSVDPVPEARKTFDCHLEGIPYPSERWEVAFYRPLASATAIVLLGGGRYTLTTGIVALAQRIPLYSVATFGGSGRIVWQAIEGGRDLPVDEHRLSMGNAWQGDASAEKCLLALEEQSAARQAEEQAKVRDGKEQLQAETEAATRLEQREAEARQRASQEEAERARAQRTALSLHCVSALTCLTVTLFCVYQWQARITLLDPFISILLGGVFAGMTGSSILGIRRWYAGREESTSFFAEVSSLVLGAVAGFVASLIFVLGQVMTLPQGTEAAIKDIQLRRMIPFVAVVGLVAGLTWHRFFDRLGETDLPTRLPGTTDT